MSPSHRRCDEDISFEATWWNGVGHVYVTNGQERKMLSQLNYQFHRTGWMIADCLHISHTSPFASLDVPFGVIVLWSTFATLLPGCSEAREGEVPAQRSEAWNMTFQRFLNNRKTRTKPGLNPHDKGSGYFKVPRSNHCATCPQSDMKNSVQF